MGEKKTLEQETDEILSKLREEGLEQGFGALLEVDWDARRRLAERLCGEESCVPSQKAFEVLRYLAFNESEWRVRKSVAETLGRMCSKDAADVLYGMMVEDPHPTVQAQAMKSYRDVCAGLNTVEPDAAAATSARRTRGAVRQRSVRLTSGSLGGPADSAAAKAGGPEQQFCRRLENLRARCASPSIRNLADQLLQEQEP